MIAWREDIAAHHGWLKQLNFYRNLKFPDTIYDHISQYQISQYQEQKANAE